MDDRDASKNRKLCCEIFPRGRSVGRGVGLLCNLPSDGGIVRETSRAGQPPEAHQIVDDVKKYLIDGFYFSYGYDLTASRQRRITWMQ